MNEVCTPLDLEIQDFKSYKLIIDARSPREFAVDHIPGALNLPVVDNDQFAEVGTLHRKSTHSAYLIGVAYSLRNMADSLEDVARICSPSSKILVYCFRGGKRSKLWADTLRTVGYKVDVLPGGWKAYRRWVISCLEVAPRNLNLKVITGPTGCGKTRLLKAIERQGGQVLDLEGLAQHRGSLLGAIPGHAQPTQKTFDSMLLDRLRQFDSSLPVFVESESKKIGSLTLPPSLMDVMLQAELIRFTAPLSVRVQVWQEDFPHFVSDPQTLLDRVQHLQPFLGKDQLASWSDMAKSGSVLKVFEELMVRHYDPAYAKSNARLFQGQSETPEVQLLAVNEQAMDLLANELLAKYGENRF